MDREEFERIAPRDDALDPAAPGVIPPARVVHPTRARKGFAANRRHALRSHTARLHRSRWIRAVRD